MCRMFVCLDRKIPLLEKLDMIGMDLHGMGAPLDLEFPVNRAVSLSVFHLSRHIFQGNILSPTHDNESDRLQTECG